MPVNQWFTAKIPIPEGYVIYEENVEVAGIQHHKAAALKFVTGKNHSAELEPEPTNPHDGAAIKVIGVCSGFLGEKRYHIGYIPGELAARLHDRGLTNRVRARLLHIYQGRDADFVDVQVQLIGLDEDHSAYRARPKRARKIESGA